VPGSRTGLPATYSRTPLASPFSLLSPQSLKPRRGRDVPRAISTCTRRDQAQLLLQWPPTLLPSLLPTRTRGGASTMRSTSPPAASRRTRTTTPTARAGAPCCSGLQPPPSATPSPPPPSRSSFQPWEAFSMAMTLGQHPARPYRSSLRHSVVQPGTIYHLCKLALWSVGHCMVL